MAHELHRHLSADVPIHPAYQAVWAPELDDASCRTAMLADPRLFDRICDFVLLECFGHSDPLPLQMDFPQATTLADVLRRNKSGFLAIVGLLWHAPAVAPVLVDRAGRNIFEDLTRAQMRACLRFRDHAPADLVGMPENQAALELSGAACLSAWMTNIPQAVADRVKVRLPPTPMEDTAVSAARIALFDAVLVETAEHKDLAA